MWEIYAYGNTELLRLIFDGVVMVMDSGDYLGLIRVFAMIAFIAVFLASLMSARFEGFKWFIGLFFMYSIMFVPRVDVVIVDRLTVAPPYTVGNVPIGLAVFGHTTSKIGDWLTRAFETVFTLPTDLKYGTNGPLFGHRILELATITRIPDSQATTNLHNFIRDCTLYDISEGWVSANVLRYAPVGGADAWFAMSTTNPARLTSVNNVVMNCDNAYTAINGQINGQLNPTFTLLGRKLNPQAPPAAVLALFQGQLANTYNYMHNTSATAQDIMRQSLVVNHLLENGAVSASELGDSASSILEWSSAQSRVQTKNSYSTMANIAKETLPLIRNGIELIMYAVFPFVFLMLLMPIGMALNALKSYALTLMWLQLWAPLFAVMSLVVSYHRAANLPAVTNGLGLNLDSASSILNGVVTDMDVAGYMVISIPMIAWMIIKGGEVAMSSVASQLMQPSQGAAGQAAAASTMGNLSMGMVSSNVTSHDMASGNKYDQHLKVVDHNMRTTENEKMTRVTGDSGYTTTQQKQSSFAVTPTVDYSQVEQHQKQATTSAQSGFRSLASASKDSRVSEANAIRHEAGKSAADESYDSLRESFRESLSKSTGRNFSQQESDTVMHGVAAGLSFSASVKSALTGNTLSGQVTGKAGYEHRSLDANTLSSAEEAAKGTMKEHGVTSSTKLGNMYAQTSYYAKTASIDNASSRQAQAYFDESTHHQVSASQLESSAVRTQVNLSNVLGSRSVEDVDKVVMATQDQNSATQAGRVAHLNTVSVNQALPVMPNNARNVGEPSVDHAPSDINQVDLAKVGNFKNTNHISTPTTIDHGPKDRVETAFGRGDIAALDGLHVQFRAGTTDRAQELKEEKESASEATAELKETVKDSKIPGNKEFGNGMGGLANRAMDMLKQKDKK